MSRALTILCLVPLLAACANDGDMRLYPLSGPVAQRDSSTVIPIKLDTDSKTSGIITFRIPGKDGTKCRGTFTSVAPKEISHERGFSLGLRNLGGKIGNKVTDVGGVNSGEIYAVCNDGTKVQGSFISGSGTQSGTGTVSDTRGNSYKLLYLRAMPQAVPQWEWRRALRWNAGSSPLAAPR